VWSTSGVQRRRSNPIEFTLVIVPAALEEICTRRESLIAPDIAYRCAFTVAFLACVSEEESAGSYYLRWRP
jgi:hypothetical protein